MDIKAQTLSLFQVYQQTPTVRLRNRIATLNHGLAQKVASKVARDSNQPFEDLEQVAVLGLLKAIEKFDPRRGCAFSTFAVPYIRGEISHYRRDKAQPIKIPRSWWDKSRRLKALLEQGLDQESIAAKLRIPQDELPNAIAALSGYSVASLEQSELDIPCYPPDVYPWEIDIMLHFRRREDGLIDATAICQHHNKRFGHYWQRRGRRYAANLQRSHNATLFHDIGRGRNGRAWVCDAIALDIARWCDPSVQVKLDDLVLSRTDE